MYNNLQSYLNDHLAGSFGAVSLIQDLADRQEVDSDREFLLQIKGSVESDQNLLRSLLVAGGMVESKALHNVGTLTAKVGRLKLMWEGFKPGELGMFEAYELLSLGLQGRRLLWVVLAEVAPQIGGWQHINFVDLEVQAIVQRDAVESYRVDAGRRALVSPGP